MPPELSPPAMCAWNGLLTRDRATEYAYGTIRPAVATGTKARSTGSRAGRPDRDRRSLRRLAEDLGVTLPEA